MVEIMIKSDPTNHILKREEQRQKKELHPKCLLVYQSVQISSLSEDASPHQTSPIVYTPSAIEDATPLLIEDL